MVMNLPSAISPPTTPLAAASRSPGSGCSRTSDRKTYFAIAMSAAASTPWPGDVAEDDGEPPLVEREEVVHVAADLEPGRRLVGARQLEPRHLRQRARQQRLLHGLEEVLLLLVQARVVDREGRVGRERGGGVE